MLIFEKFKIWAFRKVYGLWGYLQPVKSYGALKSKMGTVTDLSLEISCIETCSYAEFVSPCEVYAEDDLPEKNT